MMLTLLMYLLFCTVGPTTVGLIDDDTLAPITPAPVALAPVAFAPVAPAPVASAPVAFAPVASAPLATAPLATAPASALFAAVVPEPAALLVSAPRFSVAQLLAPAAVVPTLAPAPAARPMQDANGSSPRNSSRLRRELAVMETMLDKRVIERHNHDVFLVGGVWGWGDGTESLYIAGDGALFLMRTRDPVALVGRVQPRSGEDLDEWDQELARMEGRTIPDEDGEEKVFDAKKVARVKSSILSTLAEFGARLTSVPGDEAITVVLRGAMPTGVAADGSTASGGAGLLITGFTVANGAAINYSGRRSQQTVLSVRVRRADCVAVNEGRMSRADFDSLAVIWQY